MDKPTLITLLVLALCALNLKTKAADVSDLTYRVSGNSVIITDCDPNATGDLIIPDKIEGKNVMSIYNGAFRDCEELTSVRLPKFLRFLKGDSFANCKNLTKVFFNSSLETIEGASFDGCVRLTDVVIPNSVTQVGAGCFRNTAIRKLIIPDSVTFLGYSFVEGCSELIEVEIGDGVEQVSLGFGCRALKKISYGAKVKQFNNNNIDLVSLVEINVADNNPYAISEDGIIFTKDKTELKHFLITRTGNYVIPDSVTKIGVHAFQYSNLNEIIFGKNVKEIKERAFSNSKIEKFFLNENLKEIGRLSFGSSKIQTVSIPNGVNSIDTLAFNDCDRLISISLPDSITDVETRLLSNCDNLKTVIIGKNVNIINEGAFKNCCKLEEVIFKGDKPRLVGSKIFFKDLHCSHIEAEITVYISPDSKGFESTFSEEKLPVVVLGTVDTDGDGVFDDDDKFPNDPNETVDSDGDGVGDNADAFPNYKGETADSDGDGIGDNAQSSIAKTEEINTLQAQIDELLARPTLDQLAALEAERDARPTQAAFDAVVAERDAKPTAEQLAAVEAERDARPTKTAYDTVVAERDAKPTLDEIKDGRLGSIVITPIPNTNTAILNIDIEQSDDLKTWTLYRNILESIPLPEGKKFYRFALDK